DLSRTPSRAEDAPRLRMALDGRTLGSRTPRGADRAGPRRRAGRARADQILPPDGQGNRRARRSNVGARRPRDRKNTGETLTVPYLADRLTCSCRRARRERKGESK